MFTSPLPTYEAEITEFDQCLQNMHSTELKELMSNIEATLDKRKLFVLFEDELHCDPLTDHKVPKSILPLFEKEFSQEMSIVSKMDLHEIHQLATSFAQSVIQQELLKRNALENINEQQGGQIDLLSRLNSTHEDNLYKLEAQIKELETQIQQMATEIKEESYQSAKIGKMYEGDGANVKQFDDTANISSLQVTDLQKRYNNAQKALENNKINYNKVLEEVKLLELQAAEALTLRKQYNELKEQFDAKNALFSDSDELIVQLQAKVTSQQEEIGHLTAIKQELSNMLTQHEDINPDEIRQQIESGVRQEFAEQFKQLKSDIAKAAKQIEREESKNGEAVLQLQQKSEEIADLQQQLREEDDEIASYEQGKAQAALESKNAADQLTELKGSISQYEKQVQSLSNQLIQAVGDGNIKEKHVLGQIQAQLAAKAKENEKLAEELKASEAKVLKYQNQLAAEMKQFTRDSARSPRKESGNAERADLGNNCSNNSTFSNRGDNEALNRSFALVDGGEIEKKACSAKMKQSARGNVITAVRRPEDVKTDQLIQIGNEQKQETAGAQEITLNRGNEVKLECKEKETQTDEIRFEVQNSADTRRDTEKLSLSSENDDGDTLVDILVESQRNKSDEVNMNELNDLENNYELKCQANDKLEQQVKQEQDIIEELEQEINVLKGNAVLLDKIEENENVNKLLEDTSEIIAKKNIDEKYLTKELQTIEQAEQSVFELESSLNTSPEEKRILESKVQYLNNNLQEMEIILQTGDDSAETAFELEELSKPREILKNSAIYDADQRDKELFSKEYARREKMASKDSNQQELQKMSTIYDKLYKMAHVIQQKLESSRENYERQRETAYKRYLEGIRCLSREQMDEVQKERICNGDRELISVRSMQPEVVPQNFKTLKLNIVDLQKNAQLHEPEFNYLPDKMAGSDSEEAVALPSLRIIQSQGEKSRVLTRICLFDNAEQKQEYLAPFREYDYLEIKK